MTLGRGLGIVGIVLVVAPWSCGGDDAGGSPGGAAGQNADAATDVSSGGTGGGAGGTGGAGGSGGIGASSGNGGTAGSAGGGGAVVVNAEDASYSLEQGGQVDAMLGSVSPPDPAYTFLVVSGPTHGELLSVDAATGRFVYTTMTIGSDTFEFAIQKDGQALDTATITLTTAPLDFFGAWELHPLTSSCSDYSFTVSPTDAGDPSISPSMSACIKKAAGVTLYGGGTSTTKLEEQALGTNRCVNDIANYYYCHAFRYWRITSRDDFQSIETVSGSYTAGGQQYLISGSVRGIVRRAGDTGGSSRAALSAQNSAALNIGTTDGTPKALTLMLENKGGVVANIGKLGLPAEVAIDGAYPGSGGTCGTTLDPGATCSVKLVVTATAPASGTTGTVPLSVYFSDAAGFDLTRLSVSWSWKPPVTDAAAD